jgi:hypothetical protein
MLVRLEELKSEYRAAYPDLRENTLGGSGPSVKRLAEVKLAEERGLSVEWVQECVYKAKRRAAEVEAKEAKEAGQHKSGIEVYGLALEDGFLEGVNRQCFLVDGMIELLSSVVIHARKLEREKTFPRTDSTRLLDAVAKAFEMAEEARPRSLCPYCKGIGGLQEKCEKCYTTGIATRRMMRGVDLRLQETTYPVVWVNDGFEKIERHL